MESVDCIVVGAGVVGLAVARQLASAGHDTLILERNAGIGEETSSRSSEVIHAGLYYPAGSLKARLCVAGRHALYRYCEERNIDHRRCGKLVVASTEGEEARLRNLLSSGHHNGVTDLQWLDATAARKLEPALACHAALLSPSTGIIDSRGLMLALLADAEAAGAGLVTRTLVSRITPDPRGLLVDIDGEEEGILARMVVNAAGLGAVDLASRTVGLQRQFVPSLHIAKGNYFSYDGKSPFSRLIYPLPQPGGLGIHLTLDLAGAPRFGPDVEWLDSPDYSVDPALAEPFARSIAHYWPAVETDRLRPGYAGLRPKIVGKGAAAADFRIDGPDLHGIKGLVNLFGLESPGLTACLAIAAEVGRVRDRA
ncbi:MAG: NAD(P)/FAD-dependent oxidoreductase [Steroidobacteraceae bacterium]